MTASLALERPRPIAAPVGDGMSDVETVDAAALRRAVGACVAQLLGADDRAALSLEAVGRLARLAPPITAFPGHDALRLRLFCLLHLMAARRVQALLAVRGLAALVVACDVAATMPLNARWGFNQQKMLHVIRSRMSG